MISREALALFQFADSPREAFKKLKEFLTKHYLRGSQPKPRPATLTRPGPLAITPPRSYT
jgi:hypothetical protein